MKKSFGIAYFGAILLIYLVSIYLSTLAITNVPNYQEKDTLYSKTFYNSKSIFINSNNLIGNIPLLNKMTFNSKLIKDSYLGNFRISFYCPCAKCCGKCDYIDASGNVVIPGKTIAVDPSVIPLGSTVVIKGLGTFIASDVGGAIKKNKIDICLSSHKECLRRGIEYRDVFIIPAKEGTL